MPAKIVKRNGAVVDFNAQKIAAAIKKASDANDAETMTELDIFNATQQVLASVSDTPTVEEVQDEVEKALMTMGFKAIAKAYILYRSEHARMRETKDFLMQTYKKLTFKDASDVDLKRENANINADSAMGTMLKYGSEGANFFVNNYILPKDVADGHLNGDFHIHDKDFYLLTETCCQIDLLKLYAGGFHTGHGFLREPNSIGSAAALACIAIQANQNEMHGGQAVPHFDYCLAPYVTKTFRKEYKDAFVEYMSLKHGHTIWDYPTYKGLLEVLAAEITLDNRLDLDLKREYAICKDKEKEVEKAHLYAQQRAYSRTDAATHQAMEALVHNLNTMASRAGAQVPFSSLNYGTDTSEAGRMVIKNLLLATQEGLGDGETPIFPVQIFKVKEGVSYNPGDPNYDLFELAIETSAKRLFPNFSFLDAPFNRAFYTQPGDWNSEVAYMGCFQKDQVVTYKVNDVLFVESGRRAFDRLSSIFRIQSSGVSEYVDVEKFGVKVYDTASGGFVTVKKFIRNPEPKNWRLVKLSSGRSIVVTDDHYLPVNGKGRVRVSDLCLGDEIPAVWNQYCEDDVPFNHDKAWLLGMILCDGTYATSIVLSVGCDERELADKVQSVGEMLGFESVITKQERGEKGSYFDVRINTGSFKTSRAKLIGLFGGEKKADRHIPNQVFSWEKGAKMAFLAGMFDADGHVNISHGKSYALSLGSTNEELVIQQMLLFQALGVKSRIYRNHYKSANAGAIRYSVYAYPSESFIAELLEYVCCSKKSERMRDLKPSEVFDNNFVCYVESIGTYVEHDFCYDLETESDRFDVSGICSHNCRTRVMANSYSPAREVTCGRGNLSFTTINLPRIGIESHGDLDRFFEILDGRIDIVIRQLLHRLKIQGARKVRNYPFLMGNGIWLDSETLDWDDPVAEVLKHGTLTIGFIGLAECLVALTGRHHGESEEAQDLGLKIIGHMRERCDQESLYRRLNFSLLATPAEGLAGRFVPLDRERFGVMAGVTDKDYYTNSFHIPVSYPIKAYKKIQLEAPYHALTNGGHITYVELDGDTSKNLQAFEKIVRYMHDQGIGYGSINHPIDRDPVCGYTGVINGICPRCGRREGEGIPEEKLAEIRRKFGRR